MDIRGVNMINRQDFNNSVYQDIDMVKGDTMSFNFALKGLRIGTPVAIHPTFLFSCGDENDVLFTSGSDDGIERVSYDESSDVAVFAVYVAPEKTKDLELARYYYDLQMLTEDDVYTLMRGRLTLLREIGI